MRVSETHKPAKRAQVPGSGSGKQSWGSMGGFPRRLFLSPENQPGFCAVSATVLGEWVLEVLLEGSPWPCWT